MSDVGTSTVGGAKRATSSTGSSVDIELANVPRTELAYQVGDIIADRYRVAEVLQSQRRTTVCRCISVSDGSEINFDCFSSSSARAPRSSKDYETRKNELLKEYAECQLSRPDWFETGDGDDKRFHIITKRGICGLRTTCCKTNVHPSRAGFVAEVRKGPDNARALVERYGECFLEIDIPPQWTALSRWWFIMLCSFSIIFLASLGILVTSTYYFVDDAIKHGKYYGFLILAPFWIIVVIMPFAFCAFFRGRLYIRVTYTDFEIRRTLGFPNRRESCSSDRVDGWQPSFIDRLLFKQTQGLTKYLQDVEVEEIWCSNCFPLKFITVNEDPKKHRLFSTLAGAEKEWIVKEINDHLERVKNGLPDIP